MKPLTLTSKLTPEIMAYLQETVPANYSLYQDGVNPDYVKHIFDAGAMAFISSDDNDNITGILVFFVSDFLPTFPGKRVAVEHLWLSTGKTGMALMKAFEQYAKDKQCHYITACSHKNEHADMVESTYERLGYKPAEVTFIKELH